MEVISILTGMVPVNANLIELSELLHHTVQRQSQEAQYQQKRSL